MIKDTTTNYALTLSSRGRTSIDDMTQQELETITSLIINELDKKILNDSIGESLVNYMYTKEDKFKDEFVKRYTENLIEAFRDKISKILKTTQQQG
jgi:hypothetical protein